MKIRNCYVPIGKPFIYNILDNHLNLRKLCAQWVPRVLTDQRKLEIADVSQ